MNYRAGEIRATIHLRNIAVPVRISGSQL